MPKNKNCVETPFPQRKKIRCRAAHSPNTAISLLEDLAKDEDSDVRKAVAKNPRTPAHTLTQLVQDKSLWVRYLVARNPNTPLNAALHIIQTSPFWIASASRNPKWTKAMTAFIAQYRKTLWLKQEE